MKLRHIDNPKVQRALIYAKSDQLPLLKGDTKKRHRSVEEKECAVPHFRLGGCRRRAIHAKANVYRVSLASNNDRDSVRGGVDPNYGQINPMDPGKRTPIWELLRIKLTI
ncbi:hypothetical protein Pint_28830 [Pistacia integerrima]|uniref:Uncharacterized protein n=1 Tax=Pistacia integerrima TaxID=434235 RepID=A0ACC0X2T8_9ROSI|nr:hypothetical protein Pint_28830 [Pistacia integerrima]